MPISKPLLYPLLGLLLSIGTSTQAAQDSPSQEIVDLFRVECTSCHTIGGGVLAGPDLKGANSRNEREWLDNFVLDPRGTSDGGIPLASRSGAQNTPIEA